MLGALLLALLPSCSGERPVVVGSKNLTEQVILGEILAQLLAARSVPVERRLNLGGTFICHRALLAGDLDVRRVHRHGATAILGRGEPRSGAVYRRVRRSTADFGLAWSQPLGFENTFARDESDVEARIDDLRPEAHQGTLRSAWTRISSARTVPRPGSGHDRLEAALGSAGLISGPDGGRGLRRRERTDGLIDKFGLTVLEDDRSTSPMTAAVYRPSTAERVRRSPSGSSRGRLDATAMRGLNRQVDERAARPSCVFLTERGWLGHPPGEVLTIPRSSSLTLESFEPKLRSTRVMRFPVFLRRGGVGRGFRARPGPLEPRS
jgi:hypothetical protein